MLEAGDISWLREADLTVVNLHRANLSGANLGERGSWLRHVTPVEDVARAQALP